MIQRNDTDCQRSAHVDDGKCRRRSRYLELRWHIGTAVWRSPLGLGIRKSVYFFTLLYLFSNSFKGREAAQTASLAPYRHRAQHIFTRALIRSPWSVKVVRCPLGARSLLCEKVCNSYFTLSPLLTIFRTSRLRWNDAKETTTDLQASRIPILTAV